MRDPFDAAQLSTRLPLTLAQQGIYLGQQLDPFSTANWTAEALEFQGEFDLARLQAAIIETINQADCLHTRFVAEEQALWQEILPMPLRASGWQITELAFVEKDDPRQHAWQWMADDLAAPVNLQQGPLFQCALLHLGPAHCLWYLRVHHIAIDGYGYSLLMQQVAKHYRGASVASSASMLEVLQEEQHYRASPAWQADADFWQSYLAGAPSQPANPIAASVRRLRSPVLQAQQWQQLASQHGVDSSALLLAACLLCVSVHTGAQDLCIGVPVMNRLASRAVGLPCLWMNILPLRFSVTSEMDLLALARQVQTQLQRVRPHQRYRYEQIKQDRAEQGGNPLAAQTQLFGVVLNLLPFQAAPQFSFEGSVVHCQHHALAAGPVPSLAINLAPDFAKGSLRLELEANPQIYSNADLAQLLAHMQKAFALLQQAAAAPFASLPGWPAAPALAFQAATANSAPDVLDLLCAMAAQQPHALALAHGEQQLSYAELLASVQHLAAQLQQARLQAGQRVLLCMPRAPETICTMLAVLWLGAAYVPLDLASPPQRRALYSLMCKPI